jgi:multidrug transporter EmrE-like cation transporter
MKSSNASGLIFIIGTILFTVIGQLSFKRGMTGLGTAPKELAQVPIFVVQTLLRPFNTIGVACALLAMVSWMGALSRCELSFAYPFMGLPIVLVMALTPVLFGERVILQQWIGVAMVCLGLWVATRSGQ